MICFPFVVHISLVEWAWVFNKCDALGKQSQRDEVIFYCCKTVAMYANGMLCQQGNICKIDGCSQGVHVHHLLEGWDGWNQKGQN